jgi:hypothetical protein
MPNSIFYPSSSCSDLEGIGSPIDEMAVAATTPLATSLNGEQSNIQLYDMARDLSKWSICIRGIEERKGNDGKLIRRTKVTQEKICFSRAKLFCVFITS